MTLYHSSIKWFEINFRKPIPKGLPSSYIQLQILADLFVAHLDEAAIAADDLQANDPHNLSIT